MGRKRDIIDVDVIVEQFKERNLIICLDDYIKSSSKVSVKCNICGHEWNPRASYIFKTKSCVKCNDKLGHTKLKKSYPEVLIKFRDIHGERYTYYEDTYTDISSKMMASCSVHGNFSIIPKYHYRKVRPTGCPDCSSEHLIASKIIPCDVFVERFSSKFGGSISILSNTYTRMTHTVSMVCNKHGRQSVIARDALKSKFGCPECGNESSKYNQPKKDFINESEELFGSAFDYSKVDYINNYTKVIVRCNKHRLDFPIKPTSHITGNGGCPKCLSESMAGENNPNYKHGKTKERRAERNTPEYRQWAKAVKQDKTECECCSTSFTEWNVSCAHHMNSWVDHTDERYDLNNGVAICWECHDDFHNKYGWGYNSKDQYYQFRQYTQFERLKGILM